MLTPDETRALAVLALLVTAGAGLALFESRHPDVLALTLGDSLALGFESSVAAGADSVRSPADSLRPARPDSLRPGSPDSARAAEAGADSGASTAFGPDGRLDLNRATAEELETLPGIGPRTAERIVADRIKRGRFRSLRDLGRVKGIGPKTLARLAPHVTVLPARRP